MPSDSGASTDDVQLVSVGRIVNLVAGISLHIPLKLLRKTSEMP